MFQYAFTRTAARRLGVTFYCPPWIGDEIFCLDDAAHRAPLPTGIVRTHEEQRELRCVSCPVVYDGTDLSGYFQSPHLFDRDDARRWFAPRPALAADVLARHRHIDFGSAIGLHMRLGDYLKHPINTPRHYVPPRSYYAAALGRLPRNCPIVLCSDQPTQARQRLGPLADSRLIVLHGNRNYEDLFLLSRCRHLVLSPSTFSWWSAWLRPAAAEGQVFRRAKGCSGPPPVCPPSPK